MLADIPLRRAPLRIDPGPHRHWTTGGVELMLDRELSRSQVDVLAWALDKAGKDPNEVTGVVLEEGGVVVEYIQMDADGEPLLDLFGREFRLGWVLVGARDAGS